MAVLRLDHVAVPTWDLERAERFYRAAFGLRRHPTPADPDAFLAVQAQTRNLWAHLALHVEDLEGALERVVAAGGTVVRGAALRLHGQMRGAFICDTEQNLIELVQG